MEVLNMTLVLGPYDLNPEIVPLAEYEARLRAVRQVMAKAGANTLLVYGDTFDHGALSYLTNFTPKLGQAIAVFPAEGQATIFFSGGPLMAESARLLTWVPKVRAIGSVGKDMAGALASALAPGTKLALAIWQNGRMPQTTYAGILAGMGKGRMVEVQAELESLRRPKTAAEVELIQRAGAILTGAVKSLRSAHSAGAGARAAGLAAESEAYRLGAQDARVMTSARAGGPPLALDTAEVPVCDPLLASVAVRYYGYWAEGHVTLARSESAQMQRTRAALRAVLAAAGPGVTLTALTGVADAALTASRMLDRVLCHGVGLSLREAPGGEAPLAEGDVCNLQIEAQDAGEHTQTSAMVVVGPKGIVTLWTENAV